MSAFKGTPGPWRPSLHGPSGFTYGIEAGPSHDPVKIVKWGGIGRPSSEAGQANARLIAAAPELLEACQTALAFVAGWAGVYQHDHGLPDFHPRHKEAIEQVKSAIAKATGGQA